MYEQEDESDLQIEDLNEIEQIERAPLILEHVDKYLIDIKGMFDRDELIMNPGYQREFVWKRQDQIRLIESFALRIPVPPIYLAETEDNFYEVVDGVQRLSTIKNFFDNNLKLSKMSILSELDGLKYNNLKEENFEGWQAINKGTIRLVIIKKGTDPFVKFNLFERINTGSMKLNSQEVRNAIYMGSFSQTMKTLSSDKRFAQYLTSNAIKRSINTELVARFLSLKRYFAEEGMVYKGNITNSIVSLYEENKEKSDQDTKIMVQEFFETLKKVEKIFKPEFIFKFPREMEDKTIKFGTKFNKAVFDAQMIALISFSNEEIETINKDLFLEQYLHQMVSDESLIDSFASRTNYKVKLEKRVFFVKELLKSFIQK